MCSAACSDALLLCCVCWVSSASVLAMHESQKLRLHSCIREASLPARQQLSAKDCINVCVSILLLLLVISSCCCWSSAVAAAASHLWLQMAVLSNQYQRSNVGAATSVQQCKHSAKGATWKPSQMQVLIQANVRQELAATAAALQHAEGHHRSRVKELQRRCNVSSFPCFQCPTCSVVSESMQSTEVMMTCPPLLHTACSVSQ